MDATMDFKAALLKRQPSAAGSAMFNQPPKPTTASVSAIAHGNNSFTATGDEEKSSLMKVRSACILPYFFGGAATQTDWASRRSAPAPEPAAAPAAVRSTTATLARTAA
jgi:hypothetical protein